MSFLSMSESSRKWKRCGATITLHRGGADSVQAKPQKAGGLGQLVTGHCQSSAG